MSIGRSEYFEKSGDWRLESVDFLLRPRERSIFWVALRSWRGVREVSTRITPLRNRFSDSNPQGSVSMRDDWRITSPTFSPISATAFRICSSLSPRLLPSLLCHRDYFRVLNKPDAIHHSSLLTPHFSLLSRPVSASHHRSNRTYSRSSQPSYRPHTPGHSRRRNIPSSSSSTPDDRNYPPSHWPDRTHREGR